MIKVLKGMMLGKNDPNDIDAEKWTTLAFTFRRKTFLIDNLLKTDDEPYLGCILDKESAKKLMAYLQDCMNEKKCDKCWDATIPSFFVGSEIKCTECGEFYR